MIEIIVKIEERAKGDFCNGDWTDARPKTCTNGF